MKRLYINYNQIIKDCSLSEGKNYEMKRVMGNFRRQEIIERLQQIDIKRKTELYLKDVPTGIEDIMKKMFKGTKVIVRDISEFSK